MLVDIHPMPQHKPILVEDSGEWREIGVVERTSDFLSAITSSENVLQHTVEAGLFDRITSGDHERVDYVESVDDWADYLSKPQAKGFVGDAAALEQALRRLDADDECLRVHTGYQLAKYVAVEKRG